MIGNCDLILKAKFLDRCIFDYFCRFFQFIAGFNNLNKGEASRMGMNGIARIGEEDHALFCHQNSPIWSPETCQIVDIFQVVNEDSF